MPSEDSSATPKLGDIQASRRHFLPKLARSIFHSTAVTEGVGLAGDLARIAAVGALPLAAWLEVKGLQIPEGTANMLKRGPVTLIFGTHILPDGVEPFPIPSHDEEHASQFNKDIAAQKSRVYEFPGSIQTIIDNHMRQTKINGDDEYYIALDGQFLFDARVFPRPSHLSNADQANYPQHIHTIGADINGFDLMTGRLAPAEASAAVQSEFDLLGRSITDLLNPYSQQNIDHTNSQYFYKLAQTLLEVIPAVALSHIAFKNISRRTFTKLLALTLPVIKLASSAEAFNFLIPFFGDENAKKALTILDNTYNVDSPLDLSTALTYTRTCLMIGKTEAIAKNIDLVLGTAHTHDAPAMLSNPNLRMQIIGNFMHAYINAVQKLVHTKFPDLVPHLDKILYFSVCSLSFYTDSNVNIPWGYPDTLPKDFNPLQGQTFFDYNLPIYALARKQLATAGIDCNRFPQPRSGYGENALWTNDELLKDYSK